jgi:hypothetical protein
MSTETLTAEPSLMEKAELIRILKEIVRGGFGKEVHDVAEEKLLKLLKEL